ncbi:MAG: hypothetical protein LUH10_13375 [Tannerellaceae bacterium]|nr:hypothetical protein [Tannerellaceae bacterium]
MSKLFPTKKELGNKYEKLATFLTFIPFTIWIVFFYVLAVLKWMNTFSLISYLFLCPALLLGGMRCAYLATQYEKRFSGTILLVCNVALFLLSLTSWFFPVF